MKGVVFDIQRAALHDGPGLRTTVFLKGCPLRCAWCHNPESQRREPERGRSGRIYGRWMTVEEVMEVVRADRDYFEASGGGMTLSGGEPTAQFGFCLALLRAAKAEGLSTCLDTCGHFPARRLSALLPWVDVWHYDWKASDPESHRRWTGVDGRQIRRNLESLRRSGARVRLRCPLVPGANTTPGHLARIGAWEGEGVWETVERLTYHTFGHAKYTDLGRAVPGFGADESGRGE